MASGQSEIDQRACRSQRSLLVGGKSQIAIGVSMSTTASTSQQLVRDLIGQIRSAGLVVGDRLPSIRDLAEQLGTGTNAVRDAMMQAQTMGLVKIHPRSGAFVQSLSYAPLVEALSNTLEASLLQVDHNLFHLLEARLLVEAELVALAAQRRRLEDLLPVREALDAMAFAASDEQPDAFAQADVAFHLAIANIAGNSVLTTMLQAMLGLLRPYLIRLPWTAERRRRTDASHGDIYRALVDGHIEQARAAMRAHLGMAYESLLSRVQSIPEPRPADRQTNGRPKTRPARIKQRPNSAREKRRAVLPRGE
jgi:DNA-binding FadR family transcriptional regulator